jgi:hypothetical protein
MSTPVLRLVVLFALLAPAAAASSSTPPDAPSYDLVALAEPRAVAGTSATYEILEVFAGEVATLEVVVEHPTLTAPQRQRLTSGDRVIVMARRQASGRGALSGPCPLRATPEAVASFRAWSAPPDVAETEDVEAPSPTVAAADVPRPPRPRAPAPAPMEAPPPYTWPARLQPVPGPGLPPAPPSTFLGPSASERRDLKPGTARRSG